MRYQRHDVILKAEKVCVSYDKMILRDVDFEVRDLRRPDVMQGQVVSIIGRSGIGKSQLFRCLAGLQKPTSGRVLIGNEQRPVHAGEVGVVPQNYVLLRHRTVEQNLAIAKASSGGAADPKRLHQFHADDLDAFELKPLLKKYPHQLSGGQRQRVSILQQLLTGNHTVLLDEPFSGLDAPMIEKVLDLLTKVSLMHELNTLVIVSHDIESALAISDTALVLAPCPPIPDPLHYPPPERKLWRDGATIVHTVDLAERGLAFQPGIRELAGFRETVREVKSKL